MSWRAKQATIVLSAAVALLTVGCRREPQTVGGRFDRRWSCDLATGYSAAAMDEYRDFDLIVGGDGQLLVYARSAGGWDLWCLDPRSRGAPRQVYGAQEAPGLPDTPHSGELVGADGGALLTMVGHGVEDDVLTAHVWCLLLSPGRAALTRILERSYEASLGSAWAVRRNGVTMPMLGVAATRHNGHADASLVEVDFLLYDERRGGYERAGTLETSRAARLLAYAWERHGSRLLCLKRLAQEAESRGDTPPGLKDSNSTCQIGTIRFDADGRALWAPEPLPPLTVPSNARWWRIFPDDGSGAPLVVCWSASTVFLARMDASTGDWDVRQVASGIYTEGETTYYGMVDVSVDSHPGVAPALVVATRMRSESRVQVLELHSNGSVTTADVKYRVELHCPVLRRTPGGDFFLAYLTPVRPGREERVGDGLDMTAPACRLVVDFWRRSR